MKVTTTFWDRLLGRSDVHFQNDLYMRRWKFFNTRRLGLRVHHILRSDRDRELHDHPFNFISIILKGGYWEHLADGSRIWHGPGSILYRKAETLHRLELPAPCWTFVVRGRVRRRWGFMTPHGWIYWKHFAGAGR